MKYYEINEESARLAHEMMSFRDYKPGSKTDTYRLMVDQAYERADRAAKDRPDEAERIYAIADRYAKQLAENFNNESRIGCMCPSIMISGGSNFPVKKKEKQNAAADRNHAEYLEIQKLLDKIDSIRNGKDIIKSGDEDALEKLQAKLDGLKELQERMKAVNAYYRKHKSLDGCPDLTPAQIEKLQAAMSTGWRTDAKPFESFQLTNNNANIRRIEARIKELSAAKAAETKEEEHDGVRVVENTDAMRLQLFFDGKPEPEIRDILKGNGFRWAPSQGCWQRQLTDNARYALQKVLATMKQTA